MFPHGKIVPKSNQISYKVLVYCRCEPLPETETLPSAKFFAECQKSGTRQRIALDKDFFPECRALGKGLLRRVPDSRQKSGTRHRLTRVTVFGHVLLCRVPAVRMASKYVANYFFFFLKMAKPALGRYSRPQSIKPSPSLFFLLARSSHGLGLGLGLFWFIKWSSGWRVTAARWSHGGRERTTRIRF